MKKHFILDTNVILHDPDCINSFDDNILIIPILVLEELDKVKIESSQRGQTARAFIRTLDTLLSGKTSVVLSNKCELIIHVDNYDLKSIPLFTFSNSIDNRLLNFCLHLQDKFNPVILVTKDINLRLKGNALGILSQDYEKDKSSMDFYKGYRIIETDSDIINDLFNKEYLSSIPGIKDPIANEFFVLKSGKQTGIARYVSGIFKKVVSKKAFNIESKNLEQTLALDLLLDKDIPLVTLTGGSGCGKTLLSLAAALENKKEYLQIFLAKPTLPMGQDIGFLPGDVKEKMEPYMQSFWDNVSILKSGNSKNNIDELIKTEKIKIEPLPYLRGRSLPRIFFTIDEAQNLTPHEVKTIITRAGEGAKFVLIGDVRQIDTPYLDSKSNGLTYVINKFKDNALFGHVTLTKSERSKLSEVASELL